jgi:hypothetical protein
MVWDMISPFTALARLFQFSPKFPLVEIWAKAFPDALMRG